MLVFGGDGAPQLAVQTGNDSAWKMAMSDYSFTAAAAASSQPMRRIHHAAEVNASSGQVWVVGGEKDDGSGILMDELWTFGGSSSSSSSSSFVSLEAPPSTVCVGLVEATTTLLSDGTLLVLGGMGADKALAPLDANLASYSTKTGQWHTTNTSGSAVPAARMGHVAVSLPDQRVFIHGGSNADQSQALSDAWILDWSQNPPVWSEVPTSGVSAAPSARFGHAAVAYGLEVAIAFGYAGNAPADAAVYTFDASSMTRDAAGTWSGGQWSSSYAPSAASSSTSSGSSSDGAGNTSSSSQGESDKGSSSSSSGSNSGDGDGDRSGKSDGGSFGSTSPTAGSGSGNDGGSGSSSSGRTAGAVLGSLVGLGLVAGAGYAYYRRQQQRQLYDWRRGDGADDLLPDRYDDPYMAEKGIAMHSVAAVAAGARPSGPRPMSGGGGGGGGGGAGASPWSPGHAKEGSGPHFKQRLAMLTTGLGFSGQPQQQQRFDMLADEDDDFRSIAEEEEDVGDYHGRGHAADADEYGDYGHSHGHGHGYAYGDDYGRVERDEYEESPFEEDDYDSSHRVNSDSRHDLNSDSHSQPHTSFSDAQQQRSALIRRSPTWWDRFMNQSFLERSASGRLLPGPRAEEPIRDPARPPELSVIRESPRSADPSWGEDPFVDGGEAGHDFGHDRLVGEHGRSQSSLKTTTSSVLEHRLRNMDVIQRVRTGSSFDQGAPTASTPTDDHSTMPTSHESTPGTVVWDGGADTSLDIGDLDMTPMPSHEQTPSLTPSTTKRARNNPEMTAPLSPPQKRARQPPVVGSVKDRVKAIERKRTLEGEELLPVPRLPPLSPSSASPALSEEQFVPGRGGRPILTKLSPTAVSPQLSDSPARYSHGLVPKAQLFVANPDGRRRSSSGTS